MFASRNRVMACRRVGLGCTVAIVLGLFATTLHAQKYETIAIRIADKDVGRLKMVFETARRNSAGLGASQQDVDDYLKKYYFPQMTSVTPQALGDLASNREKLMGQYIPQAGNAATQQYLIDLTYNVANVLARGNFHPAVRYNAVLMLGDLDQQLPSAASPTPVPHAKATQALLELIENDKFKNVTVPESVKLAAVIGLQRHSRLGIQPALADQLTKAMINVIGSTAPEDVDDDVHDWLRSSAANVLANQYAKAPTKEVQAALTALIADQKAKLDDRCAAAGAMQKITYPAGVDIDGNATTVALGQLTMDVITDAAKLAKEFNEQALGSADFSSMNRGGGGGYGGRGGYGGGRGGYGGMDGEEERPRFEKRQLFARLSNIAGGSKSLHAGVGDEAKGQLAGLVEVLNPVMLTMEDKGSSELDVTQDVLSLQRALKDLVESWNNPVAAN